MPISPQRSGCQGCRPAGGTAERRAASLIAAGAKGMLVSGRRFTAARMEFLHALSKKRCAPFDRGRLTRPETTEFRDLSEMHSQCASSTATRGSLVAKMIAFDRLHPVFRSHFAFHQPKPPHSISHHLTQPHSSQRHPAPSRSGAHLASTDEACAAARILLMLRRARRSESAHDVRKR